MIWSWRQKLQAQLCNLSFRIVQSVWLHNSADYIEKIEPKKIKDDITEQAPRNPGKSLLVAAAAAWGSRL
jgi:hypothetical protein